MNQFNIFLDFYRIIAEMTEEEIVSAIGSPKYRNTVESVRRIFLEQGEKAANEEKKKLPSVTFSANYRGGRSNATLVKYLGYIVIDIDHLSKEELARILQTVRACSYTRIAFISPKGMGLKIIAHTQRPDGTLPDTIQEIEDFHNAAYNKVASFYSQLCQTEIDTSGQDVGRTCLLSYDPGIYFNRDATPFIVEQPPLFYKTQKKKKTPGRKKQETDNNPVSEETALNYHSSHASLMVTLNYYHNKSEKYTEGNRNNYLHHLACKYNRHGIPDQEAAAFIKSLFTDLPAVETDSLIASAYAHTEEFNTNKLNSTQKRMLQIEQHISECYETRYNELLHIMEYRRKVSETEQPDPFRILDDRMENSIWMEMNELGYACNVKMIQNLIYSDFSSSYHPIREYFKELPEWDGTDYIRILADSVRTNHQSFWTECLERYLVGMCAAATQDDVVNHTVLLLCSEVQNIGKTTFINNLLPPELRTYLSTGLINPNSKDDLAKIAQSMLINLDEFEGMSGRDLNTFKDLVTRKVISIRLPYARRSQNFPHTASFAGTCNYQEILHDTTGNRRFLCFHADSIEFIKINYTQLYAQIKHLLNTPGYQYWFTQEDNNRIEKNNEDFIFHSPEEELVLTHIRKPERFEKVQYLTVSEIAELIRERTGYQYSIGAKIQIGKVMVKHNFESKKGRNGRRYAVFVIAPEQVKSNRLYE
ncbi:BT4734/BF3469 family protein [Bacteroides finegoldii]|jgi:virE domain protein|uniref:BT4734/BF3469 family protein n=1 Tax=Bacteroides finegoldii TaxID=338188 RepID=UPI00033517A4|nr:BT4734/BF3469 family protein [Bacteroides finegoldii]MDC7141958.1 BT4734/BF3469 family protein [Bacteroides finegoldii]CDC52521.1 virE domain protein [Bacteroides finegoldii CAG:203]